MNRLALIVGISLVAACGGSNYYIVKDPSNGQTYYATEYKTLENGAVKLTDAKTQSTVTLPTSQIQKVEKEEYEAKLHPPPPAPAPTPAPATQPSPAPAPTPTSK